MIAVPSTMVPLTERVSISVTEAAGLLGISREHAYDLNSAGKLPGAYRMGGRILVHVPTLLAEIEHRATKAAS
jgi:excisionase family DNA binding protein